MDDLGELTEWILHASGHGFRASLGGWSAAEGALAANQGYSLGYVLAPLGLALCIEGVRGGIEFYGKTWNILKKEHTTEHEQEDRYRKWKDE